MKEEIGLHIIQLVEVVDISQDERAYYTFYGIEIDDWGMNFPGFSNYHNLLVKEYISEDASTTSSTAWTAAGVKFIYPQHIKKKFYMEGVIEGHITFTSDPYGDGGASQLSDYRVSIIKVNTATDEDVIAHTSVVSVIDDFDAHDYKVYPFWIDVWSNTIEIGSDDRIGIKVEWNVNNTSSSTVYLSHENWQQGEDIKITLPFLL